MTIHWAVFGNENFPFHCCVITSKLRYIHTQTPSIEWTYESAVMKPIWSPHAINNLYHQTFCVRKEAVGKIKTSARGEIVFVCVKLLEDLVLFPVKHKLLFSSFEKDLWCQVAKWACVYEREWETCRGEAVLKCPGIMVVFLCLTFRAAEANANLSTTPSLHTSQQSF